MGKLLVTIKHNKRKKLLWVNDYQSEEGYTNIIEQYGLEVAEIE